MELDYTRQCSQAILLSQDIFYQYSNELRRRGKDIGYSREASGLSRFPRATRSSATRLICYSWRKAVIGSTLIAR